MLDQKSVCVIFGTAENDSVACQHIQLDTSIEYIYLILHME